MQQEHQERKVVVDVRPLKTLSSELLASDSMLRRVLLREDDEIPASEYPAKLGTWLAIMKEEFDR